MRLPYSKDLIGPLAEAARGEGLKFGLYYSQAQDWIQSGRSEDANGGGGVAGTKPIREILINILKTLPPHRCVKS